MSTQALLENIKAVYRRMSHAAMRAGRGPDEVKLIAVTKTVGVEQIGEAIDAGLRIFGENRVQEAQRKVMSDALRVMSEKIEWHLIGHLQRNKAKHAVQLFDLIHSVDSVALAEDLNRHAEKAGKVQDALVEVKLSREESKHGVSREELRGLLERVSDMKHLNLRGLMTVPPFFEDPGDARPYFRELRELRDRARERGLPLPELSMGMSQDFEVAIEEGATMVRVGTAIFGERE
jgi:pyridoxal phosphate enzyme (YggS family)